MDDAVKGSSRPDMPDDIVKQPCAKPSVEESCDPLACGETEEMDPHDISLRLNIQRSRPKSKMTVNELRPREKATDVLTTVPDTDSYSEHEAGANIEHVEGSSDEDSDEWQEVEDIIGGEISCRSETATGHTQDVLNKKAVEICISVPESSQGKVSRAGTFDWARHVQWQVNRYNKALQVQIHKVHLVCLLAGALRTNEICNSAELQAMALSHFPIDLLQEDSNQCSNSWLEKAIKWSIASFKVKEQDSSDTGTLNSDVISQCMEAMLVPSEWHLIQICLIILRAIGLQARLVQSFQPAPLKYSMLSKVGGPGSTKNEDSKIRKSATKSETSVQGKHKVFQARKKAIPVHVNEDLGQIPKKGMKDSKSILQKQQKRRPSTLLTLTDETSDSDLEGNIMPKEPGKKHFPSPRKRRKTTNRTNRQILSSDSGDDSCENLFHSPITKPGRDSWIEVYSFTDEKWICVDFVEGHLNRPDLCEQNATKPMSYVVAVDNDNSVKDVTKRYASRWMFETEKLRVQSGWWQDTLKPYNTKFITKDKQEDDQLYNHLQEKPLPSSIACYKNHHLYVLKRHLLKFEALYPESASILGYCKGEAVYSRDCVHVLHSKETWLKEGLTIRADEKPYKMVKARPKKNKSAEPLLELYGKWQTELYIPFPAVGGKVPRNEYGNVVLFQPSMLPAGTVHLCIPGLNQTARKLGIDCVPAMVGWDYHGGYSHPVLDGYVVCKEFQEILLDAWEEDQIVKDKKENQKKESRISKNLRKLVNGLLINHRLTERFRESHSLSTRDEGHTSYWPPNRI